MARYNYNSNNTFYYYWDHLCNISMPIHFFLFILILSFILGLTWYIHYVYVIEERMMNNFKLFFMLSPLLLLLLTQILSHSTYNNNNGRRRSWFPSLSFPLPEKDSLHRAGGSPWGVALLLVFLLYMVSYQSSLHERWFPLVTR
ncbi:hypothetical protein LINPERHAP2_LOCUS38014 [Linum perenne]